MTRFEVVLYGPSYAKTRTVVPTLTGGKTLGAAASEMAEWHEDEARRWRDGTHPDFHAMKKREHV